MEKERKRNNASNENRSKEMRVNCVQSETQMTGEKQTARNQNSRQPGMCSSKEIDEQVFLYATATKPKQ